MPSIVNLALRGAQVAFAAVVLGISVSLAKGQVYGNAPASTGFVAFVGGISLVGAAVGIAATWVGLLQGIIGWAIDILLILLNLAGGILFAVKIKGVDCSSKNLENLIDIDLKDIINGGIINEGKGKNQIHGVGYAVTQDDDAILSRCKQVEAVSAFEFLTLVVIAAALTLGFLHRRK